MVNIRIKLIFVLVIVIQSCNVSHSNVKERVDFKDINSYLELNTYIEPAQDTLIFNEEIKITMIFKNKTDTSVCFYPQALLYIDRYIPPNIFIAGEDPNAHFFNMFPNFDLLVILGPNETYSYSYILYVSEPLFRLGPNKLLVTYGYKRSRKVKNNLKANPDALEGRLITPTFDIYVKEE